jgi:DNA-binding transcriptional MerR regulator
MNENVLTKESNKKIKNLVKMLKYYEKINTVNSEQLKEQIINDNRLYDKHKEFLLKCLNVRKEPEYKINVYMFY